MNIAGHDIGVCSWSLRPRDMAELVDQVRQLNLQHIQLALAPLVIVDDKRKHQELAHLRNAGLTITAGMYSFPGEDYSSIATIRRTGGYVPDSEWDLRRKLSEQCAKLANELQLSRVTTHIGFIPRSADPAYHTMIERVGEIAAMMQPLGLDLLLETGQESAPDLLQFLNDLGSRNVHINFDPANMILYGAGDPIEAIGILNRHIGHVHVKDALLSDQPGTKWGKEVPFGQGQVPPVGFLKALHQIDYRGPLVIECEYGGKSEGVQAAIQTLQSAAKKL